MEQFWVYKSPSRAGFMLSITSPKQNELHVFVILFSLVGFLLKERKNIVIWVEIFGESKGYDQKRIFYIQVYHFEITFYKS